MMLPCQPMVSVEVPRASVLEYESSEEFERP